MKHSVFCVALSLLFFVVVAASKLLLLASTTSAVTVNNKAFFFDVVFSRLERSYRATVRKTDVYQKECLTDLVIF